MFAYNTTMSSSTRVMPQYAMFGREATLPVDWVFPTPSAERRTMYQWTGDMLEERQHAYKSMREVQGGRVWRNAQLYKPFTQNIRVWCLVWYFDPRIIPGTSHKQRLFWAGTIPGIQADSSVPGRDQTGVLPWRREAGEPGHAETIPQRRCGATGT